MCNCPHRPRCKCPCYRFKYEPYCDPQGVDYEINPCFHDEPKNGEACQPNHWNNAGTYPQQLLTYTLLSSPRRHVFGFIGNEECRFQTDFITTTGHCANQEGNTCTVQGVVSPLPVTAAPSPGGPTNAPFTLAPADMRTLTFLDDCTPDADGKLIDVMRYNIVCDYGGPCDAFD